MSTALMRIVWDISHQEFTIADHYYFSALKQQIEAHNWQVIEVGRWKMLSNIDWDTLVLNYPEKPFSREETQQVRQWLAMGRRVVLLAYYNNEDYVADACNSLAQSFEIHVGSDAVYAFAPQECVDGDALKPICQWVEGGRVVMPCSCSLQGGVPIVTYRNISVAVGQTVGKGILLVCGTCVFWDNFSIGLLDNRRFATWLLAANPHR